MNLYQWKDRLKYNEIAWMEYKGSEVMEEQENISKKEAQKVKDID